MSRSAVFDMDPERQTLKSTILQKMREKSRLQDALRKGRETIAKLKEDSEASEEKTRSLLTIGQLVSEVLKKVDDEKYIVKGGSGARCLVNCRRNVPRDK